MTEGDSVTVESLAVIKMKSIWEKWNRNETKTMTKRTTIAAVSLVMAGLTIPNPAVAQDKKVVGATPENVHAAMTVELGGPFRDQGPLLMMRGHVSAINTGSGGDTAGKQEMLHLEGVLPKGRKRDSSPPGVGSE